MSLLGSLGGTSVVGSMPTGSKHSVGGIAGASIGSSSGSSSSFDKPTSIVSNVVSNSLSDSGNKINSTGMLSENDMISSVMNNNKINNSNNIMNRRNYGQYNVGNSYDRTSGLGLSNPEYISYADSNMLK